jgi:phage gp29-like protein
VSSPPRLRQCAARSRVAAAIPDTTKIEIVDAPNNNDVHDRLASLCNAEMSKAILGGTLGSDAGTKGARSLGEVHERNELMIARADAASLAATLRRDLLRPMVEFNFGPTAPVPSFAFAVDPAADLDKLSERLDRFVSIGGKVSQRTARNLLQIPDPEPGDELLAQPKAPEPKPPQAPPEG